MPVKFAGKFRDNTRKCYIFNNLCYNLIKIMIPMKRYLFLIVLAFALLSCKEKKQVKILVSTAYELNEAIANALPGDDIVMANGTWSDVKIKFYGIGTKEKPIQLRAETAGEVLINGQSFLHLGGQYLIVNGLYFKNGFTPESSIIRYKIGQDSTAFNSIVKNCAIEGFTKPNRLTNDHWVEFFGQHNTLSHCYISGKSNDGETIRVFHTGNENTSNYHQIVNNYFGPRPRKGGPRAETIRIGDSKTSMSSGFVNVANNYFERCNGEVEIISDKTNFNSFKNNIFYKCEGSLVLRHGSFTKVDSNIFIGGDDSNFYGGIRVVSTGHWITNNYFYKIKGSKFRSPLAVMNGIPMSPINRYKQVTDIVVAYNTWIDCKSPWQIGVGQNKASADVLPRYEIRSAPPIRSVIANNLIYNTTPDEAVIVNHDTMDGIAFYNNILDNAGVENTNDSLINSSKIEMKQINDWLFAPENRNNQILKDHIYFGFGFDKIEQSLFGASRATDNSVGAITHLSAAESFVINKENYGPDWYKITQSIDEPKVLKASSASGELNQKIAQAKEGDIIELTDSLYTISPSLKIDKKITIRSKKANGKVKLVFGGEKDTAAFQMYPGGNLVLENLTIQGQNQQIAFAPLKNSMASAYNLHVENCIINGFTYVLKAYKASFADSIYFSKTHIQNCDNGFVLAAEEKGDYNVEMLTFKKCHFKNVAQHVIHFYRGGYDESTIGGCLSVLKSTFSNCGKKEKNKVLIKNHGIINVEIRDNVFKDNPVKYVAILWGEKNNVHSDNTVTNSGNILVEQQQKQDILY